MRALSAGVIASVRQPSGFAGGLSRFDVSGNSLAFRADVRSVPPHPNPLPAGEGALSVARCLIHRARLANSRAALLPLPKGEGRGEGEQRESFRVSLMEQALPEGPRGFVPLTTSSLPLCRRPLTAGVLGRRSAAVAGPLHYSNTPLLLHSNFFHGPNQN
jgi:hypothetical protein